MQCTRYGGTVTTADFVRCQDQLAAQRRARRVALGYDSARLIADAQAACESYRVPRATPNFDTCVQEEFPARRPG